MKSITLVALAGTILLCGCTANNPPTDGRQAVADRGTVIVGSHIPRKNVNRADGVGTVDKQQLENDRVNNNGTNNASRNF